MPCPHRTGSKFLWLGGLAVAQVRAQITLAGAMLPLSPARRVSIFVR